MAHHFYLIAAVLCAQVFAGQAAEFPEAEVRLVRVAGLSADDSEFFAGLQFRLPSGWHVYWKNPGDSGAAPKFKMDTKGARFQEWLWPAPERIAVGSLTNFGYRREVVFPGRLRLEPGVTSLSVRISFEFLACKVECMPHIGSVDATFSVEKSPSVLMPESYPIPQKEMGPTLRVISQSKEAVKISIPEGDGWENSEIFPIDGQLFSPKLPSISRAKGKAIASLEWAANAERDGKATRFLLVQRSLTDTRAVESIVALAATSSASVLEAIVLAFFGGILLNLMPCVFPVLSIKVLSFAAGHESKKSLRRSGMFYSLGVILSFAVLGGGLLILRAGGEQLGWGFQLQYPPFIYGLAILFFLIGLNFLGRFELGYSLMNFGGTLSTKKGFSSAFGTGVLATVVATPCTAPFMGSALGLSLLLPPFQSLMIFVSLGVGMAAPFLLLCYVPKAIDRLPRPGKWMETVKELLAFPMFLTAIWLGWVLIQQTGAQGFVVLGVSLVGISFGEWLMTQKGRGKLKGIGIAVFIASIAIPVFSIEKAKPVPSHSGTWEGFQPGRVEASLKEGTPVFLDFTASWCITCQWNKKSVLDTPEVMALFKKHGVKLVEADWTDGNAEITKALEKYGRNSVPLYVYLTPDGKEKILPELLTSNDIQSLFE